jgi:hypothetical protein
MVPAKTAARNKRPTLRKLRWICKKLTDVELCFGGSGIRETTEPPGKEKSAEGSALCIPSAAG